jgi:hypothetical protein
MKIQWVNLIFIETIYLFFYSNTDRIEKKMDLAK